MKSENRIQQECYMWFWNKYPHLRGLLFHVPNGGARSLNEGKLFKAIGLVPGVADLLLMYKGNTYCLELKTEIGKQSKVQQEWQMKVEKHRFNYYVVRSLDEFISIIQRIVK